MSINTSGFGAYDIRGKYPESINQELAYRVGRVFPEIFSAKKVAIAHDIRLSSPTISDALARGLTEAGCDVYDLGQCGTEFIYFATSFKNLDGGIMITASHNPQEYNGLKFVKKESRPISSSDGLFDIKDAVEDESRDWSHRKATGTIYKIDVMQDYIKRLLSYVDVKNLKPFKIVINTGNGSAGPIINELEKFLPFEIIKIHNDPDLKNLAQKLQRLSLKIMLSAELLLTETLTDVFFSTKTEIILTVRTWSACSRKFSLKKIPAQQLSVNPAHIGIRRTLWKNSAANMF